MNSIYSPMAVYGLAGHNMPILYTDFKYFGSNYRLFYIRDYHLALFERFNMAIDYGSIMLYEYDTLDFDEAFPLKQHIMLFASDIVFSTYKHLVKKRIMSCLTQVTAPSQFIAWYKTTPFHNSNAYYRDIGAEEETKQSITKVCDHQWVNVGFTSVKMVCRLCDKEQGQ